MFLCLCVLHTFLLHDDSHVSEIIVRTHKYAYLHTNRTGMVEQLFAVMSRCREPPYGTEPPAIRTMCFDIVVHLCKQDKACATAGIHEAHRAYLQCPLRPLDDAHGAGASSSSETPVSTRPAADLWPEFRGPRVPGRTLESDAKFFDMMRALVEQVRSRGASVSEMDMTVCRSGIFLHGFWIFVLTARVFLHVLTYAIHTLSRLLKEWINMPPSTRM